ncbi:BMP family protein [Sediminispirochaeta smaragdinae]|uniref:Basic membrane lipoprotein n=1 Tax=Sediminispirochaeta smaragdinae (strain DSM 11293 / JCM 15392 / SEBR 4228) TaxID=573413 RepID=E1R8D2_SEDSS|nr:BMP family protein [Sediminispirochaeta smaragdinae]ADK79276.1 basic membrane lipoprotein [Sediminispirochaeta smaragdinae DSM 11293]
MKNLKLAVVLVLLSVLVFGGCQGSSDDKDAGTKSAESKLKVAMVLPGLKTDEAFNQFTYEGMMRAAEDLDIETAFVEEVKQDEQIEVIRQFAQQGYDIIIGQGGQFGEALQTVAKEYPDQEFVFSVATDTGGVPNLTAVTVSYSHAGYIAGIMAGQMTKNNKVAMILGEWYTPHRQMWESFQKGVAASGKDVEVKSVATGSWSDVNKAREASLALIADGVDVLLPVLDAAYVGVLSAAQDSDDVLVVGSVLDMAKVAPEVVVGSVVYNWNELGYQEATGEITDGGTHILGIKENGITPVLNDLLSDEGKTAVEDAIAGLKAGNIDILP